MFRKKKARLLIYLVFALAILGALAWGIFLGDPGNMRVEASGL